MTKYSRLTDHLQSLDSNEWHASFKELEKILGFLLPESARRYPAWWANDARQGRQANAWLSAGWKTEDLNLTGETVSFRKAGSAVIGSPKATSKKAAAQPKRAEFNVTDLPVAPGLNPLDVGIRMTWRILGKLTLDSQQGVSFPAVPEVAGLYRFRLTGGDNTRHYIGETMQLRRRFAHYRNPGPSQATNIRINALFTEHLAAGETITVDIVTAASMLVNGQEMPADFRIKAVRRLFEHAAIVAEDGTDIESLNR